MKKYNTTWRKMRMTLHDIQYYFGNKCYTVKSGFVSKTLIYIITISRSTYKDSNMIIPFTKHVRNVIYQHYSCTGQKRMYEECDWIFLILRTWIRHPWMTEFRSSRNKFKIEILLPSVKTGNSWLIAISKF